MKNINFQKAVLCACILVCVAGSGYAQNLIINGDAEVPPYTGTPSGWTSIAANWVAYDASNDALTAQSGAHYFFAGDDSLGILQQDVSLSAYTTSIDAGIQAFIFNGYIQTYEQDPTDLCQILVQCLDNLGNVTWTFNSDTMSHINGWKQVRDTIMAPPGTRGIRVQLRAIRFSGTDNDGYFDNISLAPYTIPTSVTDPRHSLMPLTISPNPNHGDFELQTTLPSPGAYIIYVMDVTGRTIYKTRIQSTNLAYKTSIHLSSSDASGVYFLYLQKEDGSAYSLTRIMKE